MKRVDRLGSSSSNRRTSDGVRFPRRTLLMSTPSVPVNLDAHFLRHEACGCVIRKEDGVATSRKDGQASSLAGIEGKGPADSARFRIRNGRCRHQSGERLWERSRTILEHLVPHNVRHQ